MSLKKYDYTIRITPSRAVTITAKECRIPKYALWFSITFYVFLLVTLNLINDLKVSYIGVYNTGVTKNQRSLLEILARDIRFVRRSFHMLVRRSYSDVYTFSESQVTTKTRNSAAITEGT